MEEYLISSNLQRFKYWFKSHLKQIIITILLSIVTVFILKTYVFADDNPMLLNTAISFLKGITDTSQYENIANKMRVEINPGNSTFCNHNISWLYDLGSTIDRTAQSAAIMISTMAFLIGLLSSATTFKITIEDLIKHVVLYAISVVLISNAMNISFNICSFGNSFADSIAAGETSFYDTASIENAMIEACNKEPVDNTLPKILSCIAQNHITTPMSFILVLLVPFIIQKGCSLLISFALYSRGFEIFTLSCLASIPCAFISRDILSSGCIRFFKNLIAIAIQGSIIIIVLKIAGGFNIGVFESALNNGFTATSLGDAAWSSCVSSIAAAGMCLKSSSIAQKIVGLQ